MQNEIANVSETELTNVVVMPNHADLMAELAELKRQLAEKESPHVTKAKHKLPYGNILTKIPDEVDTLEEILNVSKLNYSVSKIPNMVVLPDGRNVPSGSFSIVRNDTGKILTGSNSVGPKHTPLQNGPERFAPLIPYLENKQVKIEYAGDLNGGERTIIVARLLKPYGEIRKGDEVGKYMVISDAYNGLPSFQMSAYAQRLVCGNGMVVADNILSVRVRHYSHVVKKVAAIADDLGRADEMLEGTFDQYKQLAASYFRKDEQLIEYVSEVLGMEKVADKKTGQIDFPTRSKNTIDDIMKLIHKGKGNGGGTWWDAYNGVTEYLNHERGRSEETRLESLWFGQSNRDSKTALEVALKMAA